MYGKEGGYSFIRSVRLSRSVFINDVLLTHSYPHIKLYTQKYTLYSRTVNKMWHYLFVLFHHVLFGQKSIQTDKSLEPTDFALNECQMRKGNDYILFF